MNNLFCFDGRSHVLGILFFGFLFAYISSPVANMVDEFIIHDEPALMPIISFVDGEGLPVTLENLRGKVLLLNIWATWCTPCRVEMPTLDRLQEEMGAVDFKVVALSIDRGGVEVVSKFYELIGIRNLTIYVDDTNVSMRELKIVGLPTTFLIDPLGRKIGTLIGPAEWDAPEMVAFLRRQVKMTKEF